MRTAISRSFAANVFLIAAPALLLCTGIASAEQEYEFIHVDDFLTNYGLGECYLFDINDNNTACGTATAKVQWGGGSMITYTGLYWTPTEEKTAIPMSWPKGISDDGLMVGVSQVYEIGINQFTNLPLLPGTYPPLAMLGVNDVGTTVGYVQICNCSNSSGVLQIPYVWDAKKGARTLAVPGANGASRINNNGKVIGWLGGWSTTNGYIYDLNAETYMLMSSVFESPNVQTTAVDINDLDVVVGARKNSTGSITWGYTWSAGKGVTLMPLPPAGYQPHVHPSGINDEGTIIGSMYLPNASSRPFVYDEIRGIRDLATLTTPIPGFTMLAVTAINNNGWIVGYGTGGGAGTGIYTSFVLKPLSDSDPVMGDVDHDGDVDGADLGLLLSAWGTDDADADINDDGVVDGADMGLLLSAWS